MAQITELQLYGVMGRKRTFSPKTDASSTFSEDYGALPTRISTASLPIRISAVLLSDRVSITAVQERKYP